MGTNDILRRTFFYTFAAAAIIAGVFNTLNVITVHHDLPQWGLMGPIVGEASSWLTLMAFFWIPWIAYRLAPPRVKPRGLLLLHFPVALAYSFTHVVGFNALRQLVYWLAGTPRPFQLHFPYEFRKDVFAYALFIGGFTLMERLLRQQQLIQIPGQSLTFDIRDGAKLTRVRLSDILAISSAGNYVEFALADGRRLLMRSPLSAVESDLAGRGFVRTHRSWLVNEAAVTGLQPEGSGDYGVTLGDLTAPLSRRFPAALARLRTGTNA